MPANRAKVVLAARRQDELASVVSEIEALGGKATAITTDVSAAKDVERMVAHAITAHGRLDYAVHIDDITVNLAGVEIKAFVPSLDSSHLVVVPCHS